MNLYENSKVHKFIGLFFGFTGLISSIVFFNTSITGFSVSNMEGYNSTILGAVSFIVGLLGFFYYIRTLTFTD